MVLVLCHSELGPISQSDWGRTEHCVQVTGPETCRLHSCRPAVGGGAGHTHCVVTPTYWVMINPIRRTGSHNSLLIVSSPTPAIVTAVWAIIEIPSGWHRQCERGRLGTICPRDILRLTYLISINRFEAGWVSFNGRILADNADMSH